MMPRNLQLILAYDGSGFHGWQRQAGVRSVQGEVEATLRPILRHPLTAHGASRTDAGVHARGQCAHVPTDCTIPIENLRRAVAHHLPPDLALVHLRDVAVDFHASRSALCKLYRYRLYAAPERPVEHHAAGFTYHVWYALDEERLREAARRLVGRHDFQGFATAGSPKQTTVRTIQSVEVSRAGREIRIDFVGDGFLYNQVRNMVGTLIEIARGRWPIERIDEVIAARDRRLAGPTAPAHGLCLEWIRYPRLAPAAGPARVPAGGETS